MTFYEQMEAAGHRRIDKDKFFVRLDDNGNVVGEVEECQSVDINGDPIHPHVWVPFGKEFRCYNGATRTEIERKIKDKEKPDVEIGIAKEKMK